MDGSAKREKDCVREGNGQTEGDTEAGNGRGRAKWRKEERKKEQETNEGKRGRLMRN